MQLLNKRWAVPMPTNSGRDTFQFTVGNHASGGFSVFQAVSIGCGKYGTVIDAIDLHSASEDKHVAIKVVKKQGYTEDTAKEVTIMKKLDHSNIIQLLDSFDDGYNEYLVLEKADKDLWAIVAENTTDEDVSLDYFLGVVRALEHCHQKGIVHRDIKLENILVDSNGMVKITDFGLSASVCVGSTIESLSGSPHYCAPEVWAGTPYDPYPAEAWSLGVLLFAMLLGRYAFDIDPKKTGVLSSPEYAYLHRHSAYPFTPADKATLSSAAMDLINQLLQPNPSKRLPVAGIKYHSWCQKGMAVAAGGRACTQQCTCDMQYPLEASESFEIHRPEHSGRADDDACVVGSYVETRSDEMCFNVLSYDESVARSRCRDYDIMQSPEFSASVAPSSDQMDCNGSVSSPFVGH